MTELAGAELIMSVHPKHQAMLLEPGVPREQRINLPIDPQAIDRLRTIPEFVRSYEADGMAPTDFIAYGASQKTLSQFDQVGWSLLESFDLAE
jgi:transaldolase